MIELVALDSVSADDIENLLDDAFGTDRQRRTAYLLRQGVTVIDHLSYAVYDDRLLIGSIQCWPVAVGTVPLILVGPVAVSPSCQNQGMGHRLMNATLDAILATDPPMMMIGDPEYYNRFGFVAERTVGWTLPGPWEPRRLLLRNPERSALPQTGMIGPRL